MQGQAAALAVVVISGASVVGYRWVVAVNPVDRSHAIDLFRAGRSELAVGAGAKATQVGEKREPRRSGGDERRASSPGLRTEVRTQPRSLVAPAAEQPDAPEPSGRQRGEARPKQEAAAPEEGVYSWETQGHEEVEGARREFPAETQRIITLTGGQTWSQHHYFSEERQMWTAFRRTSTGVEVTQQRNKVTFGPVTRESEIDFAPPMLVAPRPLRVGLEWQGDWTGETYGTYSSEVFQHSTMTIGGQVVEVWGMNYRIELRGEQEGQVNARVWFAPGPGLTVKEHYVQDVESSGARYHAEWTQTLKSLQPSR